MKQMLIAITIFGAVASFYNNKPVDIEDATIEFTKEEAVIPNYIPPIAQKELDEKFAALTWSNKLEMEHRRLAQEARDARGN